MRTAKSVRLQGKQYQLNIYVSVNSECTAADINVNSDCTAADIHCCSFSIRLQLPISKALAREQKLQLRSHAQALLDFAKKYWMQSCLAAELEGTPSTPNPQQLAVQRIRTFNKFDLRKNVVTTMHAKRNKRSIFEEAPSTKHILYC